MHSYLEIEGNPIYKGMKPFSEDFHPYHEEFPLFCSMLLKIQTIPMGAILYGKRLSDGILVDQDFRQYEFMLSRSKKYEWGIMNLYIKQKEHFFNHQPKFKSLHDRAWQKIPLVYETMKLMTKEEISIICMDFD